MTLAIRLSKDMEWKLNRLASKTGRTKAYYVRQALISYLQELEDMYLGAKALRRKRSKSAEYYTMREVEELLGLEHSNRKTRRKKPTKT